jgi:purine-binding chemotaxis protein CheW
VALTPGQAGSADDTDQVVLFRLGTGLCAMPVRQVLETMRPQPLRPLADAPPYVVGVSVIRGAPVPVVDLAALVHGCREEPTRLLTVRAGDPSHTVALAVTEVVGVASIPAGSWDALSPLLGVAGTPPAGDTGPAAVRSVGVAETEIVLLLDGARTVPDDVWQALATGPAR